MSERGAATASPKGAALILAFGLMLIVIALATASLVFIDLQRSFAENLVKNTQNYYLAEAGYVYAMKEAFDLRSNGLDLPSSFPPFYETLGGARREIAVTTTLLDRGGAPGRIDQWKLQSDVKGVE